MKKYHVHLTSMTPYAQGRMHSSPKLERETHDAYEARTWRERLHVAVDNVFIPAQAFKSCLTETAMYVKMQIPGQGKATYTKNFKQGVMCPEPVMLDIAPTEVREFRLFTSSQPGKLGSGRVWKHFPVIDQWEGMLALWVVDDIITKEVLAKHLEIGGLLTGVGVWRPRNGGSWGKFKVVSLEEVDV